MVSRISCLSVVITAATRRKLEYEDDANAAPNIVRDITVVGADFKYVDSTTYSNLGLMEKMVYGNGLETMVGWNKRGQISAIDTRKDLGGGAFDHRFQLSYAYYGNGQIQQILNLLAAGNLKDEKYTYDEVGRLASAQRGPDNNIQRKFEYVYDRWGNRWDQNKVAGPYGTASHKTFDITTAKDNRLIDPNHTYDLSGNLTAAGSGTSFGYNPESFMTTATTLTGSNTSVRDAHGRRVKKTVSGVTTEYFYVGAKVIAEKSGSTWTDYIFFAGQRIAQNTGSTHSTAVYLHTDHLGSTRMCTNSSGDSSGTCDYEPFGEVQDGSGCSVPTKFRFAGMEFDDETQLYHTWFRSYDPSQGRWMSVDPLPGHQENPQTLNRYVYVRNDPVNLFDPFGLDFIVIEYECLVRINPDGSREYIECGVTSITFYQTGSTPTLGGGGVQLGGSSSGNPEQGGGGGDSGGQKQPDPQQERFKECIAKYGDINKGNLNLGGYQAAQSAATSAGITTAELLALWSNENSLNQTWTRGANGEVGPAQIRPQTAQTVRNWGYSIAGWTRNLTANLTLGATYYAQLQERLQNPSIPNSEAAAAYNGGTRVQSDGTRRYQHVRDALSYQKVFNERRGQWNQFVNCMKTGQ